MSQKIIVETSYQDAGEFIDGFQNQVDDQHLVLPTSIVVAEDEWVEFHVALADQSAIFEGAGRCVAVLDNGDEREASQRFDLMLDSLELKGVSQVLYEELIRARSLAEEDATEYAEVLSQDASHDLDQTDDALGNMGEATYLSRPPVEGSWRPVAVEDDHVSKPPSSGLFTYEGGLPLPLRPPRPAAGTYYAVEPAPRPEAQTHTPDDDEETQDPAQDSDMTVDA